MIENSPKKKQQMKKPSLKTGKAGYRRDREADIPVINRVVRNIMGMLPSGMTTRGKRIVVFSGILVFAIIALFILGGFIAGMTGLYDQVLTIVADEFIIVGTVTIAVLIFTMVKREK
ncbi:MAG: hypothetical protein WC379_11110 [Methanoregula sp.]|jgi:hypothetical protein